MKGTQIQQLNFTRFRVLITQSFKHTYKLSNFFFVIVVNEDFRQRYNGVINKKHGRFLAILFF